MYQIHPALTKTLKPPVKNSLNFCHPSGGGEYFAGLYMVVKNLDLMILLYEKFYSLK